MSSTSQGARLALPAVCCGGWAEGRKDPIGQRHSPGKVDVLLGSPLALLASWDGDQGPRLEIFLSFEATELIHPTGETEA